MPTPQQMVLQIREEMPSHQQSQMSLMSDQMTTTTDLGFLAGCDYLHLEHNRDTPNLCPFYIFFIVYTGHIIAASIRTFDK